MFFTGVNNTSKKLFTGFNDFDNGDNFIPCHWYSVIASVVYTGDKFIVGDNDTGDKFIAGDKNVSD
jgi:hypothetical protein